MTTSKSSGSICVDAVGKGLHRSKDVATRARTRAADQPLAKPRLPEHKLEDLLALAEDLVTVRDEEQGMTRRPGRAAA